MELPAVLIDSPDGEIRVKGSRISLYNLIMRYHEGWTPEMVAQDFDTLSLHQIRQTFAFCDANRDEVDAYADAYQAELDRQRALATPGPSLAELRRRLEQKNRTAEAV